MSASNNGGPAFPTLDDTGRGLALRYEGMTLRDYFAAKALSALIAREPEPKDEERDGDIWCSSDPSDEDSSSRAFACRAYMFADAMLSERVK